MDSRDRDPYTLRFNKVQGHRREWGTGGGRTKISREFETLKNAVYGIVPTGGRRFQAAGVTEEGRVEYFSHMQSVGLGVGNGGEVGRSQGRCEISRPDVGEAVDDIMRIRAEMGYGIDAAVNIKVCEERGEIDLAKIWR